MIQVNNLRKSYRKTEVLKGVSFSLDSGITGLLGPNGAGKTTLLRCMLGIIRQTAGEVTFGEGIRARQREIGYLPQKYGLLKELTVKESLEYYGALKDISRREIQNDIDDCLCKVNLIESKNSRVGALSGGMVRRVGIAAALLGAPLVLIFDEPTAGLDPEERVRFKRLISNLGKTHAVLISTHIVEDIEAVASKAIILNEGEVCANGTLPSIATLAHGKCFLAPQRFIHEHSNDYYIEKYTEINGEPYARVLSQKPFEGFIPTAPSVEDGYLCITKGIV